MKAWVWGKQHFSAYSDQRPVISEFSKKSRKLKRKLFAFVELRKNQFVPFAGQILGDFADSGGGFWGCR